jgi:hypothetical protein
MTLVAATGPPPRPRRPSRSLGSVLSLSLHPRLCVVQWPPNFKFSNVDKYEAKLDPEGWLAIYSKVAHAIEASEDVMVPYLSIVLVQDTL